MSADFPTVDPEYPSTSTKHGGQPLNKLFRIITGATDVVSEIVIDTVWKFRSGKIKITNPANTANYTLLGSAISADRNVTLPNISSSDTLVTLAANQTLTNKTIDYNTNTLLNLPAGGGGGTFTPNTSNGLGFTFYIYKVSNTQYAALDARDGTVITNSTPDIGALLTTILTNNTDTVTPRLDILIGIGQFEITTQISTTALRRSHYRIRGLGMGITILHLDNNFNGTNLDISGAGTGSSILLTSNCVVGDRSIDVADASSFSPGDYIILRSNDVWGDSPSKRGEMNRVMTKSGNTIYLQKYSRDIYNTTAAASIRKINMLVDVIVENFSIEADTNALVNEPGFLRLIHADQSVVRNIRIRNPIGDFHKAFIMYSDTNCLIEGMEFVMDPNQTYMQHTMTGGTYGLSMRSACESILIDRCFWIGCWRHCFTTTGSSETDKEGVPRGIQLSNCFADSNGEQAYDTHDEGEDITFVNCVYNGTRARTTSGTDDTDAFNSRCPRTWYIGCSVFNCTGDAFSFSDDFGGIKSCQVHNIMQTSGGSKGRAVNCEGGRNEIVISDLSVERCAGNAVHMDDAHYVSLNNINVRDSARASGQTDIFYMNNSDHIRIRNCDVKCSAKHPITMAGSSNFLLSVGNDFSGSGTSSYTGANNTRANNVND